MVPASPRRLTRALLAATWLVAPWFAFALPLGLRPVDVLLVTAAVVAVLGEGRRTTPGRLLVPRAVRPHLVGLLLMVGGIVAGSVVTAKSAAPFVDIVAKGFFALLPLLILLRVRADGRLVRLLGQAFLLGTVLSVLASPVVGSDRHFDRWQGLTGHPNQLGMTIAMSVPLALALLPATARGRLARNASLLVLAVGLERSGSRSALIATALVLVVMAAGAYRRTPGGALNPRLLLPALAVLAALVVLLPRSSDIVSTEGDSTIARSAGSGSAEGSDAARERLLDEGVSAVLSGKGIVGAGYYLDKAPHNSFLETWLAGGLVALVGVVLVFGGAAWHGVRTSLGRAPPGPSAAMALSVVAFSVAILFNNALWARYGWVAFAAYLAARVHERSRRAAPRPEPVGVPA
jgi:hypothetical protein